MNVPPQRVSPIQSPAEYRLPGRPEGASDAVQDAHRQASFLLGGDLRLFEEAMNFQIRIVRDSYPSKYRTHALAALIGLWSRAYFYLTDSVLLLSRGGYVSTLPLLRAACEVIAAEEALRAESAEEHSIWLSTTLKPDETFKAFEFELGRYFSGETLASDAVLRSVYRPVSELGRPNFGATLLQVGPESNNVRLALSFADASFHLGWAEATLGWCLALALRQVRLAVDADGIFAINDEARAACQILQGQADQALARADRCRIEEVEADGNRRYLIQNFRRTSGSAPRKVVL
jgi:hypothetical protein